MFARSRQGMGPANALSYGLVALYRVSLGHFVGGHCRFSPSCSAYAQKALQARSFWSAWLLIGRRVLRCHPWHPGGADPLPPVRTQ